MALNITGDARADQLLTDDPFALLVGMLLDQQVTMETAFAGPAKIAERLGSIAPHAVAAADPEEFVALFRQTPAVHRFPGSMAARVQALAEVVRDKWGGDAAAIWTRPGDGAGDPNASDPNAGDPDAGDPNAGDPNAGDPNAGDSNAGDSNAGEPNGGAAPTGAEVLRRLKTLPGFGEQKAKIFLALLGKQCGLDADGWREAAGDYGVEGSYRSVADIVDADSLARVREAKKAAKAKAK